MAYEILKNRTIPSEFQEVKSKNTWQETLKVEGFDLEGSFTVSPSGRVSITKTDVHGNRITFRGEKIAGTKTMRPDVEYKELLKQTKFQRTKANAPRKVKGSLKVDDNFESEIKEVCLKYEMSEKKINAIVVFAEFMKGIEE